MPCFLHEKGELNAPKCWVMNGKGGVSGRQRGVKCDEMGGEIRKKHSPENAPLQQSSKAK